MTGACKKVTLAVWIVIFLALSPAVKSQPDSLVRKSFSHFVNTGVGLVKSPATWNKTDWMVLGTSAALTTASVFFIDKPVQQYLSTNRNTLIEKSLLPFEYVDFYIPLTIFAGFATTSFVTKNNYTLETAYMIAESCFYSALLTRTVKAISGRQRPNHWQEPDPHSWDIHSNGRSFYSGHTTMAFAVASVVAWRYRDTSWVTWVSYGLASAAGFQRMYYNRHWLSDVIAGAVSATAIGLFVAKNDQDNPLRIYPVVSPQITGLSMIIPIP